MTTNLTIYDSHVCLGTSRQVPWRPDTQQSSSASTGVNQNTKWRTDLSPSIVLDVLVLYNVISSPIQSAMVIQEIHFSNKIPGPFLNV